MFVKIKYEAIMKTLPNDPASRLTKREHFAALVLQGILSRTRFTNDLPELAVRIADKLIKELNKEQEHKL